MQIHEKPERTSLANTDVFAVDTGSATYKTTLATIKSHVPYAADASYVESFSALPTDTGFYNVAYTSSSDADAPLTSSGTYWWNVIQFGRDSRLIQIAVNAFAHKGIFYMREKHDSTWYGWFQYNDTTNVGSISSADSGDKTITFSSMTKEITSLSLSAGSWVITGWCRFNGCASGRQGITISTSNTAGQSNSAAYQLHMLPQSSDNQYYNISYPVKITSSTTYYLMGYEQSSVSRTLAGGLKAIRVA